MASDRANRLLCCAMTYREFDLSQARKMPDSFKTEDAAISHMMESLLFEARQAMNQEIEVPPDAYSLTRSTLTAMSPVSWRQDEEGDHASQAAVTKVLYMPRDESRPFVRPSFARDKILSKEDALAAAAQKSEKAIKKTRQQALRARESRRAFVGTDAHA